MNRVPDDLWFVAREDHPEDAQLPELANRAARIVMVDTRLNDLEDRVRDLFELVWELKRQVAELSKH